MNFINGLLDNTEFLWSHGTQYVSKNAGAVKSVINHGLKEFNAGSQTAFSGFLLVAGTYYCVKAYKDIRDGNIKNGLTKAMLGVVAVASGIYNFTNTWQSVVENANVVHCRWWMNRGDIPHYMQNCTVYSCGVPFPVPIDGWKYHCPLLRGGEGTEGFKNVYDMKNAGTHYEFVF